MPFSALKFIRKFLSFLSPEKRLELFPPFRAMGVKVTEITPDFRSAKFKLPLTWKSRNMGNAMFGGNQASTADPIAALACARLFPDYDAWTRYLEVDFRRPGDSNLELRFEFPADTEAKIRQDLKKKGRSNPEFTYSFFTESGAECTHITCTVAIRKRNYLKNRSKKQT